MITVFRKSMLSAGVAAVVAGLSFGSATGFASSHREAPFITENPKVDATDFYMFRSYQPGREDTVTLIANYLPLQDAYGGPNYFDLDEDAIYEIHVDNTGNAQEDITFQFKLKDVVNDIQLPVGDEMVSVPVKNIGAIGPGAADTGNVQVRQDYEVTIIRGDRRSGTREQAMNETTGTETFAKPLDNIGNKSIPDYAAYANNHIYDIAIPGCGTGQVFVGQRKDAFAVNLGEIFDLVNIANPLGGRNVESNDLAAKNVTAFALEVPTSCLVGSALTATDQPVIGAWTTASLRQARVLNPQPTADGKGAALQGGAYTQVSRLGMPLVNEVVIGLKDKDRFNASEPADDGQFATYVTNPTLPEILEILFSGAGAAAPNNFPRTDLVTAFLTGVDDLNKPVGVTTSEMLRLNPAVDVTAAASQNDLGVLGGDLAGFPNGRRPVDDVVDVALRVTMGALTTDAPNKDAPFTDGVQVDPAELLTTFPYLNTPLPGSRN